MGAVAGLGPAALVVSTASRRGADASRPPRGATDVRRGRGPRRLRSVNLARGLQKYRDGWASACQALAVRSHQRDNRRLGGPCTARSQRRNSWMWPRAVTGVTG